MTQRDPSILAEVHNALARAKVNDDGLILSSMPLAYFEANRSAFEAYKADAASPTAGRFDEGPTQPQPWRQDSMKGRHSLGHGSKV